MSCQPRHHRLQRTCNDQKVSNQSASTQDQDTMSFPSSYLIFPFVEVEAILLTDYLLIVQIRRAWLSSGCCKQSSNGWRDVVVCMWGRKAKGRNVLDSSNNHVVKNSLKILSVTVCPTRRRRGFREGDELSIWVVDLSCRFAFGKKAKCYMFEEWWQGWSCFSWTGLKLLRRRSQNGL